MVGAGAVVRGGPGQGVGEADPVADLEQSGVDGGIGHGEIDAQQVSGSGQEARIAQWLRRRREGKQLGLRRELGESTDVASLDPVGGRGCFGQSVSAGKIALLPRARELEQREGVSVTLVDDLVDNGRVHGAVDIASAAGRGSRSHSARAGTTLAARPARRPPSPSGSHTPGRPARRTVAGRRRRGPGRRRGRATARRRPRRPRAASQRRRPPGKAWPAPPGTGPAGIHSPDRMPVASASRCGGGNC